MPRATAARHLARLGTLAAMLAVANSPAAAADKFTFVTNWYAQAEHGGFYQALAKGLYAQAGLDLTLKMGGPQVNIMQLMLAGQADCVMGYDVQTIQSWEQGIKAVTVAAVFQKDPVVMIAHPDVKQLSELKNRTLLVGSAGMVTYWPWLKGKFGFTDSQMRPYTFNIQPFLADKNIAQQGYLASEPFAIQKEARFKPRVFMLADEGWPPYAESVVCMDKTLKERPKQVTAFLKATMEGWKGYLNGDPAAANALIKKDNPNMSDDQLAYGIATLKDTGTVMGGDAARLGIGIITDDRMKQTYDLMVKHKLVDPAKVPFKQTYRTDFIAPIKVMP